MSGTRIFCIGYICGSIAEFFLLLILGGLK